MREHIISIPGWMNARRFVDAKQYEAACKKLAKTVITETVVKQGERVLVIGTEEFMYPALLTGYEIEKWDVLSAAILRLEVRSRSVPRKSIHCTAGMNCAAYMILTGKLLFMIWKVMTGLSL